MQLIDIGEKVKDETAGLAEYPAGYGQAPVVPPRNARTHNGAHRHMMAAQRLGWDE